MRKLIIMATAVIVTAVTYGATASWNWLVTGAAPSQVWYDKSATALAENTVVYLFDAATVSQADLLASVRSGTSIAGYVKDSKLNSSSKLVAVENFAYGENSEVTTHSYNFYMAVVKGDDIFISDTVSATASALASAESIPFSGMSTATKNNFSANPTAAFSSAGWYAAAPEPTSGLMLLLGVGLMALKRKRA